MPVIEKPAEEVIDRANTYVRQTVQMGTSKAASFGISQASCRVAEAALRTAEFTCDSFRFDSETGLFSPFIPPVVKSIYGRTVGAVLGATARQLRNGRRNIRALRRAGASESVHLKRRASVINSGQVKCI